jgi:hypothetical protein
MGVASKALAGKSDGKSISKWLKSYFLKSSMIVDKR